MPDDKTTVVAQLAELVASLERDGTDTVVGLRELIENSTRHVAGSRCAGITLADGKVVSTVAATHEYATELDRVQDRYREGPCVAAAWEHHTMHIADLSADDRWPRYRK